MLLLEGWGGLVHPGAAAFEKTEQSWVRLAGGDLESMSDQPRLSGRRFSKLGAAPFPTRAPCACGLPLRSCCILLVWKGVRSVW